MSEIEDRIQQTFREKRFKEGDIVLVELEVGPGDDYGDLCWMYLPTTKHRFQVLREKVSMR